MRWGPKAANLGTSLVLRHARLVWLRHFKLETFHAPSCALIGRLFRVSPSLRGRLPRRLRLPELSKAISAGVDDTEV